MKTTTSILLFIFLMILSSCNMGRYYANYRVGGKSKHEKEFVIKENPDSVSEDKIVPDKPILELSEMKNIDSLTISDKIENKSEVSSTHNEEKNLSANLTSKIRSAEQTVNKTITKSTTNNPKKKNNHSPEQGTDGGGIWWVIASLSIALNVFFLTGSIWLSIAVALALIAALVIFWIIMMKQVNKALSRVAERLLNRENKLFPLNSKSPLQKMSHGEKISLLFYIFIGLALVGGLIFALFTIPNFLLYAGYVVIIIVGGMLLYAIMAGALDFIMPGDSMFGKKSKKKGNHFFHSSTKTQ